MKSGAREMVDSGHAGTARSQLQRLATLPFAFIAELAWNLAWFAYIPIAASLRRRGVKGQEQV
jgi:hypothetical protein